MNNRTLGLNQNHDRPSFRNLLQGTKVENRGGDIIYPLYITTFPGGGGGRDCG